MRKIDLVVKPTGFFQERVSQVMARQRVQASQVAEYYIVDLLARFMVTSNLFQNEDQKAGEREPLAVLLLKALSKEVDEASKVKLLKQLGDTSLYISGFFGDSLNRKVIDLDYYREMGTIAYRSLSGAIREDSFQALYSEMGEKFSRFVDVLTEISQEFLVQDNQNLLRLYELYVRTGSELAKKQLNEKGLLTPPVMSSSDQKKKN